MDPVGIFLNSPGITTIRGPSSNAILRYPRSTLFFYKEGSVVTLVRRATQVDAAAAAGGRIAAKEQFSAWKTALSLMSKASRASFFAPFYVRTTCPTVGTYLDLKVLKSIPHVDAQFQQMPTRHASVTSVAL